MNTIRIDILNPKAAQLLKGMVDLKLISIHDTSNDVFLEIVKKLRSKASKNPPALEEITKEVEAVRSKRYAKKRK
ncbi:hypothetical protein BH09BAC5_BH09BAC5_05860 [soil metagenome]